MPVKAISLIFLFLLVMSDNSLSIRRFDVEQISAKGVPQFNKLTINYLQITNIVLFARNRIHCPESESIGSRNMRFDRALRPGCIYGLRNNGLS